MQTDHRVPTTNTTAMRQQHRKRSLSNTNQRKRDRHDLICVVCHAPAMGYNFDQITCESCKAFFRRNALNNVTKFKCRSGTDDCIITLETRKRCKACRLKKCFEKGLRKEWIMSEEEKLTKKQKIEENRRLRAITQNLPPFLFTPSNSPSTVPESERFHFSNEYQKSLDDNDDDNKSNNENCDEILNKRIEFDCKNILNHGDRQLLKRINENYTRAVQLNISNIQNNDLSSIRNLDTLAAVVNEPAQLSTIRMITFLKLTPEFNSLHEDDRFALVKHNLLSTLFLHLSMCVDLKTQIYREPNTTYDFCYHVKELRRYSDEIYVESMKLIKDLQNLSSNDPLIIKLIMLIMIFSKGSDIDEPLWLQPKEIYGSQNIFVNLLWKYLHEHFGKNQIELRFSRLIFSCMKAQILGRKTKIAVLKQAISNDDLAPLMQSVLLNS